MPSRFVWLTFALAGGLAWQAAAQPKAEAAVGITFPRGDYGVTKTGWLGQLGVHLPIQPGLDLVVGGFYGANSFKQVTPEKGMRFYGGLAQMFLRLGDPRRVGWHLFWGLGPMVRDFSGRDYPQRSGAITAGAGLSIPFSGGEYFASGGYLGAVFDTAIAVWTVSGGVRIRLGDSSRPDRAR